ARSLPGHSTARPSTLQNRPNALSSRPTANLIVFSGTRLNGSRSSAPANTTTPSASSAPSAASGMLPCAVPKVSTMKATPEPSRKHGLERRCDALPAHAAPGLGVRALLRGELLAEDRGLVAQRFITASA